MWICPWKDPSLSLFFKHTYRLHPFLTPSYFILFYYLYFLSSSLFILLSPPLSFHLFRIAFPFHPSFFLVPSHFSLSFHLFFYCLFPPFLFWCLSLFFPTFFPFLSSIYLLSFLWFFSFIPYLPSCFSSSWTSLNVMNNIRRDLHRSWSMLCVLSSCSSLVYLSYFSCSTLSFVTEWEAHWLKFDHDSSCAHN